MKRINTLLFALALATVSTSVSAQFNKSGINAGFFDSSESSQLNFVDFHLPPLAILLENAKANPDILILAKEQQIAQAEVEKQKRHIFSYVTGHASYSYGKADMWGNNSSTYSPTLYQFQGTEQSYWNIGVNLAIPVEDILDLKAAVRRKRLEVDRAQLEKDAAFDKLKLQIVSLYVKITNNLVSLKTASEHAAIYQGAGALNQEQFQNGEISIEAFARTKEFENTAVSTYQSLQTIITSDILTLEILTHTPIITNTLTDVTLDEKVVKSQKELDKEHKEFQKQLKKELDEDKKKLNELEKADKKAEKAEKKAAEEAEKAAKKESKEKASK